MKKIMILGLVVIMILSLAACSPLDNANEETYPEIENPIEEFATLEEAIEKVGLDLQLPEEMPENYIPVRYAAVVDGFKMIQVNYMNDNEQEIEIRKGLEEEISGVYTEYEEITHADYEGKNIVLKGEKGKVQVAEWADDMFNYSIVSDEFLDSADMMRLVEKVK